ncbi:MAG: 2-C-methyl-D-erythritol 4-phosphate cytidylyltransferase [Bacteroidaceae bacterium]|nr:2-C-methyl-D-erythritol 4-phosphate cytidylyltransferase [Bacteroidaceae bacterium]
MKNIAIILAGGSGRRMGGALPKQFLEVNNRTILEYTIDNFERAECINEIAIVTHPDYVDKMQQIISSNPWKKVARILLGGKERTDSTLSALRAYTNEDDRLLIHDGVRPMVSQQIIQNVCSALSEYDVVNLAIPAVDTIIEVKDGVMVAAPRRDLLRQVQTPQGFKRKTLALAYEKALADPDFMATDDCGVVFKYHPASPIKIVEGETSNIKITYKEDLEILKKHLNTNC